MSVSIVLIIELISWWIVTKDDIQHMGIMEVFKQGLVFLIGLLSTVYKSTYRTVISSYLLFYPSPTLPIKSVNYCHYLILFHTNASIVSTLLSNIFLCYSKYIILKFIFYFHFIEMLLIWQLLLLVSLHWTLGNACIKHWRSL